MTNLKAETFENYSNLSGFTFVNSNADFTYLINIDQFVKISNAVQEISVKEKNTAGEMVDVFKYNAIMTQAVPTTISLIDNSNGEIIYTKSFATKINPIVSTVTYKTRKEADDVAAGYSLNGNVNVIFLAQLNAEVATLKSLFTISKKEKNDTFWEVDLDKAPDLGLFNENLKKAKVILENLKCKNSVAPFREEFVPILKSWQEENTKITETDKNQES